MDSHVQENVNIAYLLTAELILLDLICSSSDGRLCLVKAVIWKSQGSNRRLIPFKIHYRCICQSR